MIGPTVITALELAGVALVVGDDERAAMRALIMNDTDLALRVAHQNHGFTAEEAAEIIARIFYLTLVADINPGGAEDALQLKLKDDRVGVALPMHEARLNEARQILLHHYNVPFFIVLRRNYRTLSSATS